MQSLNLRPNGIFHFTTLFEIFESKLSRHYPFRIKIIGQSGDLILLKPEIEGMANNLNIDIKVKEFDEIFGSTTYRFKSVNGCRITYDIWQLGKILT